MPFKIVANFLERFKAMKKVDQTAPSGLLIPHSSVRFRSGSDSVIKVGGSVFLGFPLHDNAPFATFSQTILHLGDGASIEFQGSARIAPGVSLVIGRGAKLIIGDGVIIAHNTQILCNRRISIGCHTMISWNSLLIDDDLHDPTTSDGHQLRLPRKNLNIGDRVGLQANVIIPRGVSIGDDSVVSAGTVLRQDVPPASIVYSDAKLRVKRGMKSGINGHKSK